MKLLWKNILIERIQEPIRKTTGGLEFTDKQEEEFKDAKGKVLHIGSHVDGVEVGDTIKYRRNAGHPIEIDNEVYWMIQEGEIILIL